MKQARYSKKLDLHFTIMESLQKDPSSWVSSTIMGSPQKDPSSWVSSGYKGGAYTPCGDIRNPLGVPRTTTYQDIFIQVYTGLLQIVLKQTKCVLASLAFATNSLNGDKSLKSNLIIENYPKSLGVQV